MSSAQPKRGAQMLNEALHAIFADRDDDPLALGGAALVWLMACVGGGVNAGTGELGCVNPEFKELPAGSPTFRVIARLPVGPRHLDEQAYQSLVGSRGQLTRDQPPT